MARKQRKRRRPSSALAGPSQQLASGAEQIAARRRAGSSVYRVAVPRTVEHTRGALDVEREWLDALPGHVKAVSELFAAHDAFDVLANVMVAQAVNESRPLVDQDTFVESMSFAELAQMILVERPGRAPVGRPVASVSESVAGAIPHLEKLSRLAASALSQMWHKPPDDAMAIMHERFVRRYLLVPINETDEQARALLDEMFDDPAIVTWLSDNVGVSPRQATALVTAVFDHIIQSTEQVTDPEHAGALMCFTSEDLARRSGIDPDAAAAFCRLLSQDFGQTPRTWPALPTPVRHRPLVHDGVGRYLTAMPAMVRRGLRHTFAAVLNPDVPTDPRGDATTYRLHTNRRARLVEHWAVEALSKLLDPDAAYVNVHYAGRDEDGRPLNGEIDGLVVVDRTVIVVEAKSGATRIDALADDADTFAEALKPLLSESGDQHVNARKACRSGTRVRMWTETNGGRVPLPTPLPPDGEILPITVTLDDLSGCAPNAWELNEVGLAAAGGPLPWLVSVTQLQTLLRLMDHPAQLVQFLRRRAALNETQNVEVIDEIDLLLEYLHNQLEPIYDRHEHEGHPVKYLPPERFHELDRWLLAPLVGDRRARRPKMKLHVGMKQLLVRLERDRPIGWLAASVTVLDTARVCQRDLGSRLRKLFATPAGGGGFLTVPAADGGLIVLALIAERADEQVKETAWSQSLARRQKTKGADRAYGLIVTFPSWRAVRLVDVGLEPGAA